MRKIAVLLGGVSLAATTQLSDWSAHGFGLRLTAFTCNVHTHTGCGSGAGTGGGGASRRHARHHGRDCPLRPVNSRRSGGSSSSSSSCGGGVGGAVGVGVGGRNGVRAVRCAHQPAECSSSSLHDSDRAMACSSRSSLCSGGGTVNSSGAGGGGGGGGGGYSGAKRSALRRSPRIADVRGGGRMRTALAAVAGQSEGEGDGVVITERVQLGDSDLMVSKAGIGCLNFGNRVTEGEAHRILDAAVDKHNMNFIDTSEHYPCPTEPSVLHEADLILASWMKTRKREDIILSTKVIGRCANRPWLREGGVEPRLTREQIIQSVDDSLLRLKTDYIDLLQLEWGDRYVPEAGEVVYDITQEREDAVDFEVQLMALEELMEAGKVRHIGLSNETPYALCKFLEHAEWDDLPKICSMQVEYNILNRNKVEMAIAEIASPKHGAISLIGHTPLGGGALTGKYIGTTLANGNEAFRLVKYRGFQARYKSFPCDEAIELYKEIAERYGMTLQELAMRWVYARKHITAGLLGASTPEQLSEAVSNMLKPDIPAEAYEDIRKVVMKYREPTLGPATA